MYRLGGHRHLGLLANAGARSGPRENPLACQAGTIPYKCMPFGLSTAPTTFQRALHLIVARSRWNTCLIYLDDIIVFSKEVDINIHHVITALGAAVVMRNLDKCSLFTDTVDYVGHVIRPGHLELHRSHTRSIRKAHPQLNNFELRSFFGLCNIYPRFVRSFTALAAPLNALLQICEPESFGPLDPVQHASFDSLIMKLCEPTVLALPVPSLPYSLETDAITYEEGCVLFQSHTDGECLLVGYSSRSLTAAEKTYSSSERECLPVVWSLRPLRNIRGLQVPRHPALDPHHIRPL